MAEHFSFFDAVLQEDGTYDREYNAQQFTKYFGALVTTGVMKGMGNMLVVSANGSNMVSKIDTGLAFVEAKYYENDSFLELTHDTESIGKSRIDRIVIRMDLSTEARYVKAFIKKGVPSTNPVPPTLTQTPNLYEISLAQVKIVGGQTFIATNAVIDERGKDVICPWAGSKILPNFDNEALENHLHNYLKHTPFARAISTDGKNYSVTLDGVTRYVEGMSIAVMPDSDNINGNSGTFININELGNVRLMHQSKRFVTASNFMNGSVYTLRYNGAIFVVQGESILINNTLTSTSTTEAATANAVKMVNDKLINYSPAIGYGATSLLGIALGASANSSSNNSETGAIGAYSSATGFYSFALGTSAQSPNTSEGVIGVKSGDIGPYRWRIPGTLSVTGTKNFEIPHPHPDKKHTHIIRHGAVESPTTGDTLYRYTVEATVDGQTVDLQLPDYFEHLNTNVDVYVSPHKHFGRAFGEVIGDKLLITCEKVGLYKALVIGTRNDENVQDWYIKGVEREIGESWEGETNVIEVDEIKEITEFGEVLQ